MPEISEKEVTRLSNEIENLKSQKMEVLKTYNNEYKQIDKAYKELVIKRDKAIAETPNLDAAKKECENIIKAAEHKSNEILKNAVSEAGKIKVKAEDSVAVMRKNTEDNNKKAEKFLVSARELKSRASENEVKTRDDLKEMLELKEEENKVLSACQSKEKILDEEIKENGKLKKILYTQRMEKQKKISELTSKIEDTKNEESNFKQKRISYDLEASELVKKKEEAVATKQKYLDLIAEINEEREPILKELKATSENNAYRSRELDLGFEKLGNDNSVLKREMKKLNAMKKQITKKGD